MTLPCKRLNSSIWSIDETPTGTPNLSQRVPEYNDYDNGGARGIVVIVVGNGHGDTSSNPGRDWLHFI